MKRAFRFRVYPTDSQQVLLRRTFGCVRVVWNRSLRYRTDAWFERKERVNYNASSALLTTWKREPEYGWLNEVSAVPLQQCLRHQQGAFTNFFEKRAGYPRFKSRHGCQAAEFTTSAFRWDGTNLTLAKMVEPLPVRWSRRLPKGVEPSTVTMTLDRAGRWHVSILCEVEIAPLARTEGAVGLDFGVTALVVTSDGEKIVGGNHHRADLARLGKAQRRRDHKQKGSANRTKAGVKVARIHARIADRRRDQLHKLSTRLIRENQTVAIEDLNVRGMVRNRRLARAISDQGWGDLRAMLEYKAEWYGRDLVAVDRWFPSSKRCSACGHVVERLPLNARQWACPECAVVHDRDINAAVNILAAGLAVTACGDGVRPARVKRGKAVVSEAGNPGEQSLGIPVLQDR